MHSLRTQCHGWRLWKVVANHPSRNCGATGPIDVVLRRNDERSDNVAQLPNAIRLRSDIDAERLQSELFALGGDRFRPQATFAEGEITEAEYDGWNVLSLRGPDGDPERGDAGGPGLSDYADTPYMDRTPYIKSVLDALNTPLRAVRFMSLEPGASVGVHTDYPYGLPVGWARLHLPITTNDKAVIVIDDVEHRWQPGELWYANFGAPHHIYNNGTQPRVHLVIDCFATPGLLEVFPSDLRGELDRLHVMLRRPLAAVELADLHGLEGSLSVPTNFITTYAEPPSAEAFASATEPDVHASVKVEDGQLVLRIDGSYESALEHIGDLEFRYRCWTEERTIQFGWRNGRPQATFRYRHGGFRTELTRDRVAEPGDQRSAR